MPIFDFFRPLRKGSRRYGGLGVALTSRRFMASMTTRSIGTRWHVRLVRPLVRRFIPKLKAACDRYFYLSHRSEPRGIGGVFFDDWREGGASTAFAFLQSVGDRFLSAYLPILERRKNMEYGARERQFQLLRRGRYVEFNLVQDQGTKYGLQSGRRIEAVMCSMPPLVRWEYDFVPEPGSDEARLYSRYLVPRNWADEVPSI
jgi:coproporphyrinogen III oxidase